MWSGFSNRVNSHSKNPVAEPNLKQSGIRNVTFGEGVTVVQPANLYGCEIGDGAFIGPFTEIQSGAKIGARTRVQSHAFICDLVTIGEDCFIGHGVMFVNDLFQTGGPARGDRTQYRPTTIGNNVSLGSNATILPVHICGGAVIGAGAVVTRDVAPGSTVVGVPARLASPKSDPPPPDRAPR